MTTSLTPAQRSLRARIAAFAMHGAGKTNTAAATAARMSRYGQRARDEAAARGETLTLEEVARRADFLLRADMARRSLEASRARARRRARGQARITPDDAQSGDRTGALPRSSSARKQAQLGDRTPALVVTESSLEGDRASSSSESRRAATPSSLTAATAMELRTGPGRKVCP
ncbi:MAG: hypothetical protein ACLQBX_06745 [Candidatus Limnocylindrales bacterium]